jgi:molybdopterin converting factor small subunit
MTPTEWKLFTALREIAGEEQANVIVEAIRAEVKEQVKAKEAKLTSKDDVSAMMSKIENSAVRLEAKIETTSAKSESSLAWKIYTTGVAQFIALLISLFTLLKFFDLK